MSSKKGANSVITTFAHVCNGFVNKGQPYIASIRPFTVALSTLVLALPLLAISRAGADPQYTEYSIPIVSSASIASGPNGTLWFTASGPKVGFVTSAGAITEYSLPGSGVTGVTGLTLGPDGALWFLAHQPNSGYVGRITTTGTAAEYAIPANYTPDNIATGPDGALWIAASGNGYAYPPIIIRMTTSGVITNEFDGSNFGGNMIAGPDGDLWAARGSVISKMTTSGVVTNYNLPNGDCAVDLAAGPDGAIWYADEGLDACNDVSGQGESQIGRITTDGVVTEYPLPMPTAYTKYITSGLDGTLWFTESDNAIGDINTGGVITEYPMPADESNPGAIVTSSDGSLWFLTYSSEKDQTVAVRMVLNPSSVPAAPTNLSVSANPTNTNPLLSWDAASGATSYNIYRNGTEIGSTTDTTYTDASAPEGNNSYYVTAVNASGESGPSNTVDVTEDRTPPTVSNLRLSRRIVTNLGLTPLTITADASDSLSSVTAGEFYVDTDPGQGNGTPMTYSSGQLTAQTSTMGLSLGKHTIYVRAEDAAGNWSTAVSETFWVI